MHADIVAFAKDLNLAPNEVARLEALIGRHRPNRSMVSTQLDDYESVSVDLTYYGDEDNLGEPMPTEETEERPQIADRYEDLGPIGQGGMGDVRRVLDLELNRTLAMKTLHTPLLRRPAAFARFLEEAQTTAQLQHPHIVPIHDIGQHADGRVWFTMKEVRGRTLAEVVDEVHSASNDQWNPSRNGWTFKRIMVSFLAVCNAMAYAHERGVVHRDLKPDNTMVGRHGEVYVVDWGLAKVVGRRVNDAVSTSQEDWHLKGLLSPEETIITNRPDAHTTRGGTVAGTPCYMPPEQARGDVGAIDARSDVYALGAMLYEILSGRTPYEGRDAREVLAKVLAGPPGPIRPLAPTMSPDGADQRHTTSPAPPIPEELEAACLKAMARAPKDRFQSSRELAQVVQDWLDGRRKRKQAIAIAAEALEGIAEAAEMKVEAARLDAEGSAMLVGVEGWRPEEDKAAAWAKQDAAEALRNDAELKHLAVGQGLHGALQLVPTLPEAHAALADRYQERHTKAEVTRARVDIAKAETLLRFHSEALPENHPTRTACAAYLKGDGAVSLVTDPPGAEVFLHRYETHNRRLVEVPVGPLGRQALRAHPLPMGSYVAEITHPDCATVRYPFHVPRQGHWHAVAPGDTTPTPIWLPPKNDIGPNEVYVPAGWFRSGGDSEAPLSHPARPLWCDGFVIDRFPITNQQYLLFLDDLVSQGRVDEALRHAPRERAGTSAELGALIYGFDGRHFSLRPDADGDIWLPQWPVLHVDWFGARAYQAWRAKSTGRPWRPPAELEWEKAARGVDGRWFPWGDHVDPSWCLIGQSHRGPQLPVEVDTFPVDRSPYGVRGLGGNTADWCLDRFDVQPAQHLQTSQTGPGMGQSRQRVAIPTTPNDVSPKALLVVRGGSWDSTATNTRVARRFRFVPHYRHASMGLRGVYSATPRTR